MSVAGLTGKVLVVTGGSRGIGRQIVLGAAERGARVAFCAREIGPDALAVEEEAKRLGRAGQVVAVRADVSQEDDVDAFFDATLSTFGRVDIVINNAGIDRPKLLVSLSAQDWDEVIATNLTGAFLVARRAIKEFLARDEEGRIIFIGSIVQNGSPSDASYAASKGGLAGLTHSIVKEYGHQGIHATLIAAGYTETQLLNGLPDALKRLVAGLCPQGRMASDEEIASAVLFFASNRTLLTNGKAIYVSGGLLDPPPYGIGLA